MPAWCVSSITRKAKRQKKSFYGFESEKENGKWKMATPVTIYRIRFVRCSARSHSHTQTRCWQHRIYVDRITSNAKKTRKKVNENSISITGSANETNRSNRMNFAIPSSNLNDAHLFKATRFESEKKRTQKFNDIQFQNEQFSCRPFEFQIRTHKMPSAFDVHQN